MKIVKRVLMALVLTSLFMVSITASATWFNTPLTFSLAERHIAQPVDFMTWCGDCGGVDYTTGSPWVTNPTNCMWDSDDFYQYTSNGNVLAPGASVSIHECRYAGDSVHTDYRSLPTDTYIVSPSSKLLVTETFTWDAGSKTYTVTPHYSKANHGYLYFDCIYASEPIGGTLITVPDSNGGQAIAESITVTVANPTSQKIGKTGGALESGGIAGYSRGCRGYHS